MAIAFSTLRPVINVYITEDMKVLLIDKKYLNMNNLKELTYHVCYGPSRHDNCNLCDCGLFYLLL